MNNEDTKLVFFRWSAGFGQNLETIRCATDQSSEDPSDSLVEIHPDIKGLHQKLRLWKKYVQMLFYM